MALTEITSKSLPTLSMTDSVRRALKLMNEYKVSQLPVVEDSFYAGLATEDELYDLTDKTLPISESRLSISMPMIEEHQFVYDALDVMARKRLGVLPVVDRQNRYKGAITRRSMIEKLAEITSASSLGGILEIETETVNYSPALICGIAENNGMKIMSMFSSPLSTGPKTKVVIKLNGPDTTSVVQGLERYGYVVKNVYGGDKKYSDLMAERFGEFIAYMNV